MWENIAKYEGFSDIHINQKDHPLLKIKNLYGDLLYAEKDTDISKEIPSLTLKHVMIVLERQEYHLKQFREAVDQYNQIILVSLLLFSINLTISVIRLGLLVYDKYLTKDSRAQRKERKTKALLQDLTQLLIRLNPPDEGISLNEVEQRLRTLED